MQQAAFADSPRDEYAGPVATRTPVRAVKETRMTTPTAAASRRRTEA